MSYNDIATRYPKSHRRAVLLGAHIRTSFPSVEDVEVHTERDHLSELLARLWEGMRQGTRPRGLENSLAQDAVTTRGVGPDHEEESREHVILLKGEYVTWTATSTRLTKAAQGALRGVSEDV